MLDLYKPLYSHLINEETSIKEFKKIIVNQLIIAVQNFTNLGTEEDRNFWRCQNINVDNERNPEKRRLKCMENDKCFFNEKINNCNLRGMGPDDFWADTITDNFAILYMVLIIKEVDNTTGNVIFNPIIEWNSQKPENPNIYQIYLRDAAKPDIKDCIKDPPADRSDIGHAMILKKNICGDEIRWMLLDSMAGGRQYDISRENGELDIEAVNTLAIKSDGLVSGIAGFGNIDLVKVNIPSLQRY